MIRVSHGGLVNDSASSIAIGRTSRHSMISVNNKTRGRAMTGLWVSWTSITTRRLRISVVCWSSSLHTISKSTSFKCCIIFIHSQYRGLWMSSTDQQIRYTRWSCPSACRSKLAWLDVPAQGLRRGVVVVGWPVLVHHDFHHGRQAIGTFHVPKQKESRNSTW